MEGSSISIRRICRPRKATGPAAHPRKSGTSCSSRPCPGPSGACAQHDRRARLLADVARQRREQFFPVTRIHPAGAVEAEVVSARFGRDPNLPRRAVAVDDDLAAVLELELEHAFALERGIAFDPARFQCADDRCQRALGARVELGFVHCRVMMNSRVKMMPRRAAGLVLLCLLLQACGTKGPLYLPAPDQ